MIDDYARPGWAEAHEKFGEAPGAGLGRLARWLRRRAKANDEIPVVPPAATVDMTEQFAPAHDKAAKRKGIRIVHGKAGVQQTAHDRKLGRART